MRIGFMCLGVLALAAPACVDISGPLENGPAPRPHIEPLASCQETGACSVPRGDGPGLKIPAVTPALCTDDPATDRDGDGFEDTCEYEVAWAFRPRLSFDPAEADQTRESYWSALYVMRGTPTVSIMYLLAYHQDAGTGSVGAAAHRGDSEFLIVDVVWADSAWKIDRVFMSAHWRSLDGLTDRSALYDWWELYYHDVERGRPMVVVSLGKHANYNSPTRCLLSVETGCRLPGILDDVEVLPHRNVGSAAFPLLDCVRSVTPNTYAGTECFWTKPYFDGWHTASDSTPGYRNALNFFEARFDPPSRPVAPTT